MGIPSRHSGAPYQAGETLNAADLEADIANVYTEIGNIEDANVASAANIDGAKMLDNSITNAKLLTSTITTTKLAQSAVPVGNVSTDNTNDTATTSATLVDVPTISSISLTAGSASDLIVVQFTATLRTSASANNKFAFAISIDATDTDDIGLVEVNNNQRTVTVQWMQTAGGTSAQVIKPRYRKISGASACDFYLDGAGTLNKVLQAFILPIK